MGFEQYRRLAIGDFRLQLGDHAHLSALMIFIRAINIEKLQPGPLRRSRAVLGDQPRDAPVE